MRVSGKTGTGGVASAARAGGAASAPSVAAVSGAAAPSIADALSVSNAAQFIAVVQMEVAKLPEIRMDKVEQLRAQVESDAYHPDEDAVARGLLKEHTPLSREA